MITTFLWMLYLAFTLFYSLKTFHWVLALTFNEEQSDDNDKLAGTFGCILISALWSIWYFYYLN